MAIIVCDNPSCDWEKEIDFSEGKDWHRKMCPKCGESEIISDEELAAIELLETLTELGMIEPDPNSESDGSYMLNLLHFVRRNNEV